VASRVLADKGVGVFFVRQKRTDEEIDMVHNVVDMLKREGLVVNMELGWWVKPSLKVGAGQKQPHNVLYPFIIFGKSTEKHYYPQFKVVDTKFGNTFVVNLPVQQGPVADLRPYVAKPEDLLRELLAVNTLPGGLVLEMACGSAPTARAGAIEGRNVLSFDMDADLVEAVAENLKKYATHKTSKKRGAGDEAAFQAPQDGPKKSARIAIDF
jgi:DNA modification methylase